MGKEPGNNYNYHENDNDNDNEAPLHIARELERQAYLLAKVAGTMAFEELGRNAEPADVVAYAHQKYDNEHLIWSFLQGFNYARDEEGLPTYDFKGLF